MSTLQDAAPLLPADELPTLRALAELATEFQPVEATAPTAVSAASTYPASQVCYV